MKAKSNTLPPILFNEVLNGLLMLLALRLAGAPAADTVAATAAAWEVALTHGKTWCNADAPRFQTAFATLAAEAEYWPPPVALLKALPPRPEPLKLEYHHQKPTPEQIQRKDKLIKDLTRKMAATRRLNERK